MGTMFVGTVLAETVSVRNGPGLNYSVLQNKSYQKNDIFTITDTHKESNKIWGYDGNGWVCLIDNGHRIVDYKAIEKSSVMKMRNSVRPLADDGGENNKSEYPENFQFATDDTFRNIFSEIMEYDTNNSESFTKNMRLFGLPYQFRPEIDSRVKKVSSSIGRKYIENVMKVAPVVTIIPGKPKYLPGTKNKEGWTHAFMSAASGKFEEIQQLIGGETSHVRYYDFQQAYTEYMKYVNILCRTAATFLELTEELDGTPLQSYDWRNYRWTGDNYHSVAGKIFNAASSNIKEGAINAIAQFGAAAADAFTNAYSSSNATSSSNAYKHTTSDSTEEEDELMDAIFQTSNFVQFYVDPDMGGSESGSNSTSDSKIKGMFDSGSDMLKELAFIAGSGGIDTSQLQEFTGASANALADQITTGGSITEFFSRIIDVSGNVMKGENIIMPEIYNNSNYDKQYNITVHLKSPYGNRFSYYMDVLVPLFHLLALALPKQTSANTYGSPFLVKAYCEGIFTCNLGIVSQIQIDKRVSPESWTVDGFPSEIDVTLSITDLYSDLTLSPQNEPMLFLSNSSLIEYLGTTCGLNLIQPQLNTKINYTVNLLKNAFGDIDQNVTAEVTDTIENLIAPWIALS